MSNKIIMCADYRINIRNEKSFSDLVEKKRISSVCAGGFTFNVNGHSIPFDFDAAGSEIYDDHISFKSGKGPFFNDFNISEDYKEMIEENGVPFDCVTAELLSKVSSIEEFFVDFELDNEEWQKGSNEDPNVDFTIELLNISFYDENDTEYKVSDEVLKKFNEGKI